MIPLQTDRWQLYFTLDLDQQEITHIGIVTVAS